jgi:protein-disulfide isomerase
VRRVVLLALALLLPGLRPAAADSFTPAQRDEVVRIVRDALKADPSILRDALAALQADEESRQAKATGDAIARFGKQLADPADAVEGNPLGDVTMIEFYDTRCPYCRRMLPVMAELLRAEPNLKLVMKDLPILGPASQLESRALLAAQRQGGYFKLRDAVMRSSGTPTRDTIREMADHAGLDGGKVLRDLDDPAINSRLGRNIALAQQMGVQGTPAIIVGRRMIAGAADIDELRHAIAEARQRN